MAKNKKYRALRKLLVANRSEIAIRVMRSAHELGLRTVAVYTYEDRYALHRFKADEAYMIGQAGEPIRNYLNIEAIIDIAQRHGVDAIHPGYGFLSEKPELAAACRKAGIVFVGPDEKILRSLGDKVSARALADAAGVPILGGSREAIAKVEEGKKLAGKLGYPIMLKAAHGGGGRGMRVVHKAKEFADAFAQAQSESMTAFGSPDIFIEKFIARARHIEVQLLGDHHGNLVHLYERDCSVQRRHQKVVEIAPAPNLPVVVRDELCEAALKIGRQAGYRNAGTVEFLVDADTNDFYFIEVNPRIQVEHTVTEEVTGVDLVRTQILVAQGVPLNDPEIDLGEQGAIATRGFAMQCRVTTEDPANQFMPDYGRVSAYRSAAGQGIRLDAGSAFSGAIVNPFYDSMLVKVTVRGRRFYDATRKMERALAEFRIRGVKTNIPFLQKLIDHPVFLQGECTTRFIDQHPDLFAFVRKKNRANRLLHFIADIQVNGQELVQGRPVATRRAAVPVPETESGPFPKGTRDLLQELGPEKFSAWILKQKRLLITDTTMRDAHQSLLATRVRSYELNTIAEAYARLTPELFSLEMWGGATFDTSMRFLKECPWGRLSELREKAPNILFQMLLRASNAVGYTNYPDNVVKAFVKEAADAGMDVFRVFDALNWVPNMKVAMEAVLKTDAICEASICYTGDILNPKRSKYDLAYYVKLAQQLERMGAHILAVKDMAGLCKPEAAKLLIKTLKNEVGIPIHFHTHDTAGIQAASILEGAGVKLDIADAALAPMSGGTSQVNLNTLAESLRFSRRSTELNVDHLDQLADYWRSARAFYVPFESETLPATADLYNHEMPGGQYTNLYQQAHALGLSDRWAEVCQVYADVNRLFGDIVKVTPTSKAVGDMALFMVANELTTKDVLDPNRELAFPASVVDLIGGMMGKPPGGFPKKVRERILRGEPAMRGRPGATLPPVDFDAARVETEEILQREPGMREVISYLLYPRVYEDFARHQQEFGDVSMLPTPVFFYGLEPNEEIAVDIEQGKTLIIKFLTVSEPDTEGRVTVFFELNGQPREITVVDRSLESAHVTKVQADPNAPGQVGASMPGMVVNVAVAVGDKISKGQKLLVLEAMKMESTIYAEVSGKVSEVLVQAGSQVETGELLVRLDT